MGDVSDFAKLPYPVGIDAPDVPAAMMSLVESLDARVVLPATSIGDRDSKYGGANPLPAGSIVATTQAPWYVWLRTQLSETVYSWATIFEDTGWLPIPGTAWKSGWADQEVGGVGASGYNRQNGRVEIYLRAVYSGPDVMGSIGNTPATGQPLAVVGNQFGNISDIPIVELPSQARPLKGQAPGLFLASCPGTINISVAGIASITHLWTGGTLSTGTVLTYTDNWRR